MRIYPAQSETRTVEWNILTSPHQRSFMNIFNPDQFGKYGVCLSTDLLSQEVPSGAAEAIREMVEGVQVNYDRGYFHAKSRIRPPIDLMGIHDIEWLKLYQIAESKNRSLYQMFDNREITFCVRKYSYSHSGISGNALSLERLIVHG